MVKIDSQRVCFGFWTLLALTVVFLSIIPINAAPVSDHISRFQAANQYYKQGDYSKAAGLYDQLLQSGYESGNLYYNLGNTHFKLGNKGWAILYYHKALRFMPGDSNLLANLKVVQSGIPQPTLQAVEKVYRGLAYLPIDILATVSSGFFLLFSGVLAWHILRAPSVGKRWNKVFNGLAVCGILLILSLAVTLIGVFNYLSKEAIIVTASIKAGYEPNATAVSCFTVPEGARVGIVRSQADWTLIEWKGGKRGWIPKASYREI